MLAVAKGREREREHNGEGGEEPVTEPSVTVMRHRCSAWNHISYQKGGWEGWEAVTVTAELQDKRLNATFHFDRTLLLINMRTPAGVLEQSPENSRHPGDVSLLWAPRLALTLHSFASILSA